MNRELLFVKALEEVKKLARRQSSSYGSGNRYGSYISREQLEEAFSELGLDEEQLALVADYLEKHKIGIDEPPEPEDVFTGEEMDYLETYLEELKEIREASQGEREAVTISAMAGEKQAQARLVEIWLPEVVEIAKLYGGQGVGLEDLIGEGNVAVATGVTMLGCLEYPQEAEGMLGKMIMDAMEDHISDSLAASESNQRIADQVNLVAGQARELAELLKRKVTVGELAQETALSEDEIREVVRMSGNQMEDIETDKE